MRVDQTNLQEIIKTTANAEIKGNVSVLTQETASQAAVSVGGAYSVRQTSIDKPFFSTSQESELEKLQQEAENAEAQLYKEKLQIVSNTVTAKDCAAMEEDGFSLGSTEVKTIVTEMDKIKMELAKAGVDISIFGDDLSLDQLKELAPNVGTAYQMQHELEASNQPMAQEQIGQEFERADLPATSENLSDTKKVLAQSGSLTGCSDSAIKYMLDNQLAPTAENLYKAQHSAAVVPAKPQEAVVMDASLQKQVESVIQKTGLSVNEDTIARSKWMMEQGIPLTPENLQYAVALAEMKLPVTEAEVMAAVITAVEEGKRPKDAVLLPGYSLMDRAEAAVQTVEQATDADIQSIVEKGEPVTIQNMAAAHNENCAGKESTTEGGQSRDAGKDYAAEYVSEDIKYITARRQLEEIRLAMTREASYAMLKQGITIETRPLEELIEELKNLEQNYYRNLLSQNGIEATKENVSLFADTMDKAQQLGSVPAYILGTRDIRTDSVNILHDTGMALKAEMQKAGRAYEALRIEANPEFGDSLEKAFRNVDHILESMGLETSEVNQRAVRILAYNELAITEDSVAEMKAADQKVQGLFRNLTPSVVMEMIREGVNPLEMDVTQLNARAEEIKQRLDEGEEEKFSKYLWKLEQHNEISGRERDSYIGIYRLLNQIDKTDGAVIGALVNQGAELSMKNLLSAVRTRRHNIDAVVDDEFSAVGKVLSDETNIARQIQAAYQTDCAKEAFARLTPEAVQYTVRKKPVEELTPEQLLEQLRKAPVDPESEEAYYQEQLRQFASVKDAETQVLKMLADYDMPVTAYNVLAGNQMLYSRNSIFKNLFDKKDWEEHPDLKEAKEEVLADFAEAVKTPEDMAKAQKKLADVAENVMKTMAETEDIKSVDVRDLKIMRQQIELGTRMSKEENYAIPVLVADEMTNVQLKIVRGTERRGRVDVIFESPKLGKVAAKFQVQGAKVKGYIAADSQEMEEALRHKEEQLQQSMQENTELFANLDIIRSENLELARFSMDNRGYGDVSGQSEEEYQVQTRELYGIAKSFLDTVKRIGDSYIA